MYIWESTLVFHKPERDIPPLTIMLLITHCTCLVLYTKNTSFSCKCMTVIYWYSRLLISVRVFMSTGVVYLMCLGTQLLFPPCSYTLLSMVYVFRIMDILYACLWYELCVKVAFLVSFDNLSAIYWQYRLRASAFPQIIISLSHSLLVIICTAIIIQVLVLFYMIVVGIIVSVYLWDGLSGCISAHCR